MKLSKGFVFRSVGIGVGIVLLGIGLPSVDLDPHTEDSILLLYVLLTALYFAYYTTKHADELFPD
jgi:uncharacterized membrane protein YfcA